MISIRLTPLPLILLAALFVAAVGQSPQTSPPAPDPEQLAERNRLSRLCEQLRDEGKLAEALATAETMLALERKILPADVEDIRGSLVFLGETAQRAEDGKRATAYRAELVAWCVRHRGPQHWQTMDARAAQSDMQRRTALSTADRDELRRSRLLGNEMLELYGQGKTAEAIAKAKQSSELCGKVLGEQSQDYATCLTNLGFLYAALPDDEQAEAMHRRALNVLTGILGESHPQVATALNNLAGFYNRRRKYAEAEPLYRRALGIRKASVGERHADYAMSLNDLATVYNHTLHYAKAEPLLVQAVEVFRAALGDDHPEYAKSLGNLATLYDTLGDYDRAEPLYLKSAAIYREALSEKHPKYAAALNALAVFYQQIGEPLKSEPLLRQVLALRKEILGEQHADYAATLGNLAGLYRGMQDYARAEPLYLEAITIEEKTLGANDPNHALTLNNLAFVCDGLKDFARAESFYQRALAIQKTILGERHPHYATTLSNLAEHYRGRGEHARAEPLIQEATELTKQTLGEKHPAYARRLNNLAAMYHMLGDEEHAEPLYRQAVDVLKEVFGPEHADYATALHNLGYFYAAVGRSDEADRSYREALVVTRKLLESAALIQSERQQLILGREMRHRLDAYLSLDLDSGKTADRIYAEVLRWKGAVLMRQRSMRTAANDPQAAEQFQRLQRATREVAAVSRAMPSNVQDRLEWQRRLAAQTEIKETLEAELSRQSAAFRTAAQVVTVDDLLTALPNDAVLIDYLEFRRSTSTGKKAAKPTFERQWLAFVVRPAAQAHERIRLIPLGPVAPVVRAVDEWRESYGQSETAAAAGDVLRQTLWVPLLSHLADAKTMLISTDGALGRLPFAALPGKMPGAYLLEDHRLAMVPVPQLIPSLVQPDERREPRKELLLVGDVDYDAAGPAAPTKIPDRPDEAAAADAYAHFGPLEYTKAEIDAIRELHGGGIDANADDPIALTRSAATEAEFRRLAPDYRYVHLATHGFFAPPRKLTTESGDHDGASDFFSVAARDTQIVGFNPGLLSGLALAGANLRPGSGADDGVLTALEIANLPLGDVDLIALSACETGLGAVAGGEGLLGVQRAFQVAGVGTTVAGLWKVDDLQTMALMKRFYHNLWKEKLPRIDALREAQLWMLREPQPGMLRNGPSRDMRLRPNIVTAPKPETTNRSAPFYWAPFILSGDWR